MLINMICCHMTVQDQGRRQGSVERGRSRAAGPTAARHARQVVRQDSEVQSACQRVCVRCDARYGALRTRLSL